jgi:hypothetical protein
VIAFASGEYANYIDPLLARHLELMRATLNSEFDNVFIYPLGRFYFLGGLDIALPQTAEDFSSALEKRGVKTKWFKTETISGNLTKERISSLEMVLKIWPVELINRDFHPLGYTYWTTYWSSMFKNRPQATGYRLQAIRIGLDACSLSPVACRLSSLSLIKIVKNIRCLNPIPCLTLGS